MVKLRLQRLGKNKDPYYRVVATDSSNPRDGRFIEMIGTYHPNAKEQETKIDEDKALKWLNNGAQPTDTVKSLFKKTGIYAKFVK